MCVGKKLLVLYLAVSTLLLSMPAVIHPEEVSPNLSITKHEPEVIVSPEKSASTGISWWWWTLGILLVIGGVAAAIGAGGGGGDGGGGGGDGGTGSATVTW